MLQRRILVFPGLLLALLLCFQTVSFAKTYTVKKGDNLYTIAKHSGISVNAIKKANHLKNNRLKLGQELNIPSDTKKSSTAAVSIDAAKSKPRPISSYRIQKGDTLATISQKTGVPVRHIAALNKVNSRNLRVGRSLVLSKSSPVVVPATLDEEEDDAADNDEEIAPAGPSGEIVGDARINEELLGKWESPDERKLFVRVATGFLGAPYRMGGATVRGIDCSGFVRKIYEFFDVSLPRTAREQSTVGVRVDRDKLEAGDLVFFRTYRPIGHVGIYIGNNEFVHASYKSRAVRIDNLDMPYFQKRYLHAVRVKGLDENDGT